MQGEAVVLSTSSLETSEKSEREGGRRPQRAVRGRELVGENEAKEALDKTVPVLLTVMFATLRSAL